MQNVSILARTEVRALPLLAGGAEMETRFQSSPAPRCGRYFIMCQHHAVLCQFQSSPAPRCGRYNAVPLRLRRGQSPVSILARSGAGAVVVWVCVCHPPRRRARRAPPHCPPPPAPPPVFFYPPPPRGGGGAT